MKKSVILAIVVVVILIVAFLIYQKFFIPKESIEEINKGVMEGNVENMKIKSGFSNNTRISAKYTCDGEDLSPPLEISEIPSETKTLALIVDDPDAPTGTWVHWLVWNIPVSSKILSIGEGQKIGIEGKNDFRKTEYGGPCPPSGTHRYFFKVYALDSELDLEEGATKQQLESAMKGHILAKGELIGLYRRG